jgi:hypothetical protein
MNNRLYDNQIQYMNSDQALYIYKREKRDHEANLLEVLGSDAGEIEAEAAMDEKKEDCEDRGERSSKRHGVSERR